MHRDVAPRTSSPIGRRCAQFGNRCHKYTITVMRVTTFDGADCAGRRERTGMYTVRRHVLENRLKCFRDSTCPMRGTYNNNKNNNTIYKFVCVIL